MAAALCMSDGGDRYVLFMSLKCNILVVVTLEPRVVDCGTNTPLLCFFRAATSSHKAVTAVPAPKKRTRTFPSRSHTSPRKRTKQTLPRFVYAAPPWSPPGPGLPLTNSWSSECGQRKGHVCLAKRDSSAVKACSRPRRPALFPGRAAGNMHVLSHDRYQLLVKSFRSELELRSCLSLILRPGAWHTAGHRYPLKYRH